MHLPAVENSFCEVDAHASRAALEIFFERQQSLRGHSKEVSDLKKELGDATKSLDAKSKIITELHENSDLYEEYKELWRKKNKDLTIENKKLKEENARLQNNNDVESYEETPRPFLKRARDSTEEEYNESDDDYPAQQKKLKQFLWQ